MRQWQEKLVSKHGASHVTLLPHEFARSKDPVLNQFLNHVRCHRPTREQLKEFFVRDRRWGEDMKRAVGMAQQWLTENPGKRFTFLTVTNDAANKLNRYFLQHVLRCTADELAAKLNCAKMIGDPKHNVGPMIFAAGMMIRLTRNLDKERGFVNGAIGIIKHVLNASNPYDETAATGADAFVLETLEGHVLLVHPVRIDGVTFLPCAYGYATTIRKAQGSTLDGVCLWFDQRWCSNPPSLCCGYSM